MGQEDTPKPDFTEGLIEGTETNSSNGKRYTFQGHYLGDGTVIYRATVENTEGEFRGEISGVFDRIWGGPTTPRVQVESLLRAAIREAVGYRP